MPTPLERFEALFNTRELVVDLPIGLERRLRAYVHRINSALLLDGYGDEPLDTHCDFDLGIAILSLVEHALEHSEYEAGTRYDMATGEPLTDLEELPGGDACSFHS